MASAMFDVVPATVEDTPDMARVFQEAFVQSSSPQAAFYGGAFPDKPAFHKFFIDSLSEQIRREPQSMFLKAVDKQSGRLAGFIKWSAPDAAESYWADYGDGEGENLRDAFFGAMAEHREKVMGDRKHWFLELMGVSVHFARQGAGSLLIAPGCEAADRDSLEAYVDASPVATPLYERFGFVVEAETPMPAPFDWYVERFLVRPISKK